MPEEGPSESIIFKEDTGIQLRLSMIEQKQKEITDKFNVDMILEEQSINEHSGSVSQTISPN